MARQQGVAKKEGFGCLSPLREFIDVGFMMLFFMVLDVFRDCL